ncbi:hypothetical protein Tco_1317841 [Tanacetum coccineum]
MGDTIARTRFENVSKHSNDSLMARGNTLRRDDDRLKLDELMALCTTLQNRVLDLDKTKTSQHNEIASLKRRVKKLEKKDRSRTHRLKRLYKVGLIARLDSYDDEESLGCGLLVQVVLSTSLGEKPFVLEFTSFLVMTRGSEKVIGFVIMLAFTCLLGTKLSILEALKGLILKIPGEITLSLFTTVDSLEEGAEFEVTGFDKAFDSPTLGITLDLGRRVTEYSFGLEEEGGFPKIDCFENLVSILVPFVVFFCSETLSNNWALNVAFS